MKVELGKAEREYLADKTFWDWQRAKIDVMSAPLIYNGDKRIVKAFKEDERFFYDLLCKLDPKWKEKDE